MNSEVTKVQKAQVTWFEEALIKSFMQSTWSSLSSYVHFQFPFPLPTLPCKLFMNLTSMSIPLPRFILCNPFKNKLNSGSQWFINAWLQNIQGQKFFKGNSFHEYFISSQNELILPYFCKKTNKKTPNLNILYNIPIWQPTFQNSWWLKLEESALIALGYTLVMNFLVWRINSLAEKQIY